MVCWRTQLRIQLENPPHGVPREEYPLAKQQVNVGVFSPRRKARRLPAAACCLCTRISLGSPKLSKCTNFQVFYKNNAAYELILFRCATTTVVTFVLWIPVHLFILPLHRRTSHWGTEQGKVQGSPSFLPSNHFFCGFACIGKHCMHSYSNIVNLPPCLSCIQSTLPSSFGEQDCLVFFSPILQHHDFVCWVSSSFLYGRLAPFFLHNAWKDIQFTR